MIKSRFDWIIWTNADSNDEIAYIQIQKITWLRISEIERWSHINLKMVRNFMLLGNRSWKTHAGVRNKIRMCVQWLDHAICREWPTQEYFQCKNWTNEKCKILLSRLIFIMTTVQIHSKRLSANVQSSLIEFKLQNSVTWSNSKPSHSITIYVPSPATKYYPCRQRSRRPLSTICAECHDLTLTVTTMSMSFVSFPLSPQLSSASSHSWIASARHARAHTKAPPLRRVITIISRNTHWTKIFHHPFPVLKTIPTCERSIWTQDSFQMIARLYLSSPDTLINIQIFSKWANFFESSDLRNFII